MTGRECFDVAEVLTLAEKIDKQIEATLASENYYAAQCALEVVSDIRRWREKWRDAPEVSGADTHFHGSAEASADSFQSV